MIHMTSTHMTLSGIVFVGCRCKWASGPHDTRNEARTAGDKHLAEANAPEQADESENKFYDSDEHGPVPSTWFGRGAWATCSCGYDPHDNGALNQHWAEHGFKVVDAHGQLRKEPI